MVVEILREVQSMESSSKALVSNAAVFPTEHGGTRGSWYMYGASRIGVGAEITNHRGNSTVPCFQHSLLGTQEFT